MSFCSLIHLGYLLTQTEHTSNQKEYSNQKIDKHDTKYKAE